MKCGAWERKMDWEKKENSEGGGREIKKKNETGEVNFGGINERNQHVYM